MAQISPDRFFKNTVRAWIGDHEGRQAGRGASAAFFRKIVEVDIPLGHAIHREHDKKKTRHDRAGRGSCHGLIAGMRQYNCGALHRVRKVELTDREQAGILALRTSIRLQRHRGETSDLRQPALSS